MRIDETQPPRHFVVAGVELVECAHVALSPGEFVTFATPEGREYDVVAKEWGFFATPSVNNRLRSFGFRTAILVDAAGKRFVVLVAEDRMAHFEAYLASTGDRVEEWLEERGELWLDP
jgi:hypothetical protein